MSTLLSKINSEVANKFDSHKILKVLDRSRRVPSLITYHFSFMFELIVMSYLAW
jgi:hypothetical protein